MAIKGKYLGTLIKENEVEEGSKNRKGVCKVCQQDTEDIRHPRCINCHQRWFEEKKKRDEILSKEGAYCRWGYPWCCS